MTEKLKNLLSKMEIPAMRREDLFWLSRNLPIKNGCHPDFQEAYSLIRKEIMETDVMKEVKKELKSENFD